MCKHAVGRLSTSEAKMTRKSMCRIVLRHDPTRACAAICFQYERALHIIIHTRLFYRRRVRFPTQESNTATHTCVHVSITVTLQVKLTTTSKAFPVAPGTTVGVCVTGTAVTCAHNHAQHQHRLGTFRPSSRNMNAHVMECKQCMRSHSCVSSACILTASCG